MVHTSVWFFATVWLQQIISVWSHARLMSPPSRSSMWRLGFPTEKNYDDDGLYCGGFYVQWQLNDGKCGICGDPFNAKQPRDNEAGGKYGSGVISRKYLSGQIIEVLVHVTANHKGYFEFKLCPNNNPKKEASQECLDKYTLKQSNGNGSRIFVSDKGHGNITIQLQLPKGITCTQCVFQWTYIAGNNWGRCEDGSARLGCGPQETFRACADIEIQKFYDFRPQKFNKNNFKSTLHTEVDNQKAKEKLFKNPMYPFLLPKPTQEKPTPSDGKKSDQKNLWKFSNYFFENGYHDSMWNILSQFGDSFIDSDTLPYFKSTHFLHGTLMNNYNYQNGHFSTKYKHSFEKANDNSRKTLPNPPFYLVSKLPEKNGTLLKPFSYYTSFYNNELNQNGYARNRYFEFDGKKYKDFWLL